MKRPEISIVSGTYNRLPYLKAMMLSAAEASPSGLPIQFVIVDGGSTDGTLEWLHEQQQALGNRIIVIEHGDLKGAIKAFCDGAFVASGRYVVMANDDVTFEPFSITAAFSYLERDPLCGGVAFEDNRRLIGRTAGTYGVQGMPGVLPSGTRTYVTYAQVGMFRKELGDRVGWWGVDDEIMGQAKTYGGDNYLSARIWEEGYSVQPVPGARVTDHVANDELRHHNTIHRGDTHPDSKQYSRRFPYGPTLQDTPADPLPHDERLRILYLPIYENHALQHKSKRGLRLALKKHGLVYEVDYLNRPEINLARVVKTWQPHLLISQFQDASAVNADKLAYMRTLCPQMLCINWNGDARMPADPPSYVRLMSTFNLLLFVNAGEVLDVQQRGGNARYWQIGYETPQGPLPEVPAHDVVFLGNCYSPERQEMIRRLRDLGVDVGVYGASCPDANGECLYDFAKGEALYKAAKVAIGDTFTEPSGAQYEGFVSNRMIQCLGAGGAVYLQELVPELSKWTKFKADKHYVEWFGYDDLCDKVQHYLQDEQAKDRKRIAANGKRVVIKHYTFDALVAQLFDDMLPQVLEATP